MINKTKSLRNRAWFARVISYIRKRKNKNDHENKKNNTFLHGGLDDLNAVLL